jgi:hypothetical protein
MKRMIVYVLPALLLVGCKDAQERYDTGRSDGYAVGYNTTCQIRTTLIEGDWSDADYSRGYRDGYSAGAFDCNLQRQSNQ